VLPTTPDKSSTLTTSIDQHTVLGPLQTALLRTQDALTGAVDSGHLDGVTGSQLLGDLTNIKSLVESLLSQISQSKNGSVTDPNHVTGVGSFGESDQLNRLTNNLPKHDH
jgi:hypothetical protein